MPPVAHVVQLAACVQRRRQCCAVGQPRCAAQKLGPDQQVAVGTVQEDAEAGEGRKQAAAAAAAGPLLLLGGHGGGGVCACAVMGLVWWVEAWAVRCPGGLKGGECTSMARSLGVADGDRRDEEDKATLTRITGGQRDQVAVTTTDFQPRMLRAVAALLAASGDR